MRKPTLKYSFAGFTTLEVLCATTLSAMLMVAVMGLVAGMSRHERLLREKSPAANWQRRLAVQVEADLARSWNLGLLPDGFQLTGPLGRDLGTGRPTWKNAQTTYRLLDSPLGKLLVREVMNDPLRSTKSQLEIACTGVAGIELCLSTETPVWKLGRSPPVQTTLGPGPLPNQLRVLIYGEQGQPLVDQVGVIH